MPRQPVYYSERFSIKDLELFSGIKAHTIRAWERRHGLLKPSRSKTNIRSYDMDDLKTILNTSLLLKEGMSISEIAALTGKQREEKIKNEISRQLDKDSALNALKLATVTYDEDLFERTSRNYRVDHGFEALVENLFLPLLNMLGLLWQASAICPAQEHFSSNLVRQKLISAIDALPYGSDDTRPMAVLYLPENEIHELGLLYLQYHLRREGRRSIYLGESVPIEDLGGLAARWTGPLDICSVLTIYPRTGDEMTYLNRLVEYLPEPRIRFHFCGPVLRSIPETSLPDRVHVYSDIPALLKAILH
ncbi:MAG: MerR family transcriptional regulator [Flavobacteriales bacterium]|jgi:DNA-binding transcriptional MerR regulator|nr:MerR family transcriptional regulator [Flavobacteriales bacterium]MCB0757424.1 MerR family transcriptional regulator [Flavobacteriales bacterium]